MESPSVAMLDVDSNEPQQDDEHDDVDSSMKRQTTRRLSVPTSDGSKENDEQHSMPQKPANKRGRPKVNKNVRTEPDSPLAEQHQQQSKKRRRQKSNTNDPTDPTANSPTATATTAATERTIKRIESMRKRDNRHEFLATWTNDDTAEWISRDLMTTKYPQHLIAYFESIIHFNQLTTTN